MKKIVFALLTSATLISAQAQLFGPESLSGAFWGSFIGGLAGGHRHHGFSGEGAAIGAGVGLLAGAIAGEARRDNYYYGSQPYVYAPAPSVSFGYGYRGCGDSAYVYYSPNDYCAPGYYYRSTRPNYAVSGTVLGAASGALIGAGSHDAGKGAAIGAGAGLLLGGAAEYAARNHEQRMAQNYQTTTTPQVAASLPQNQITSTPSASSTYYWTARPQIPDAPRVPDAPTF